MLTKLWGRITGADKRKALPDQQASVLGRLGDYIVVYPYGSYCDLPDDVWLRVIDEGVVIPVTSVRLDTERGEPIFYHPVTGAKVHFRNSGDIDIETTENVNVTCRNANITASEDINADATGDINGTCTNATVTASTKATVTAPNIDLTGDVNITGTLGVSGIATFAANIIAQSGVAVTGSLTQGGKDVGGAHVHSGVTSGPSNTGGVV